MHNREVGIIHGGVYFEGHIAGYGLGQISKPNVHDPKINPKLPSCPLTPCELARGRWPTCFDCEWPTCVMDMSSAEVVRFKKELKKG